MYMNLEDPGIGQRRGYSPDGVKVKHIYKETVKARHSATDAKLLLNHPAVYFTIKGFFTGVFSFFE